MAGRVGFIRRGRCSNHRRDPVVLPDRILSRIDRSGGRDACHLWTGARLKKPGFEYGVVGFERKLWRVHRLVWTDAYGEIPHSQLILHHCDNPPCCNLRHLFLGTHQDNSDDKYAKGRQGSPKRPSGDAHWKRRRPQDVIRGADRSDATMTVEQVEAIRAEPQRWGVIAALARHYGVSHTTISKIRRGVRYR